MRKQYYWALALLGLLVFLACGKDFEDVFVDTFDFEFTVTARDSIFIYEGSEAQFRVEPERVHTSTKFNFTYSIEGGEGFFQMEKGEVLAEQTELELPEFAWKLNYIPTTTGTHTIKLKTKDQKGNEKEETIDYEVDFAPFTALFTAGANTFMINQVNELNLTVSSEGDMEFLKSIAVDDDNDDDDNDDDDDGKDYTLLLAVDGGTGMFVVNGEEHQPGEEVAIGKGTADIGYIPSSLGQHTIDLIAKAPDGAVRERQVIVPVENVEFLLLASTPSNVVGLGDDIDVTVSLESSDESENIGYNVIFSYGPDSEGIGTLLDEDGEARTVGQAVPLDPGEHTYKFSSEVLGSKKLYFDVSDSNDQVKRDSITIAVTNTPFSFSGQAVGASTGVNQPIEISLSLSTNAPEDSDLEYSISFVQEDGNGELKDLEDQIIPASTTYDVDPGVFKMVYKPFALGEHRLLFRASDNYGQTIESEVSLMATNAQLNFAAAATNTEITVGGSNTISVNLGELGNASDLTYEMSYFFTGGTGTLTEDGTPVTASTFSSTVPGSRTFDFTPDLPGTYTLTFILRDSNGQVLESPVDFIVRNTNFDFTAVPSNSVVPLGVANTINFAIVPGTFNDTGYTMSYTTSSNGELVLDGRAHPPGSSIGLETLQFTASYTGELVDNHTLTFTIRDLNGVLREKEVEFEVANSEFSFTAVRGRSTIDLDETLDINIDLVQMFSNPDATYEITYTVSGESGTLADSGAFAQGTYRPVTVGESTFTYTPSTEGSHVIEISIRDNNGKTVSKNVPLGVNGRDFNITMINTLNSANTGDPIPINLTITEIGGTGGTYEVVVSSTGNGEIVHRGNSYTPGERITLNGLTDTFSYIGEQAGTHGLTLTATASYGALKTATTSLDFDSLDYSFTATPAQSSIMSGQTMTINMNINELVGNSTYRLRYVLNGQNADVSHDGQPLAAGVFKAVPAGNLSIEVVPQGTGTFAIDFFVINGQGLEKDQPVSFNAVQRNYTVTATPSSTNIDINQSTNILLDIQESVGGIDTYQAVYSTNSTGTLSFGGSTIIPGQTFQVDPGQNTLTYTGTIGGSHGLSFTIIPSMGSQRSATATIDYNSNGFTFLATEASTSANLGGSIQISFNLTEEIPGIDTYSVIYTNNNNGTLVYNGVTYSPGQSFGMSIGNSTATYTAAQSGNHSLNFNVTSTSAQQSSDSASMDFLVNQFTFTAAQGQSSAAVGGTIPINFNIGESIPGTDSYTATFSNSNTGTFRYNGSTISPGQSFSIGAGNTSGSYTGTGTGLHRLTFSVTNSFAQTEGDSANMTFNNNVFTFSATEASPSANIGEAVAINFNIGESIPGIDSYTATYSRNNTGTFRYNGATISPGQSFSISAGNSSGTYSGNATGNHRLTFSVTNSFAQNRSDNVAIQFAVPFTFQVTASSTTVETVSSPKPTFTLNINSTRSGASYRWSYNSSLGVIDNPNPVGLDFFLSKNVLRTISGGSTAFEFGSSTQGQTTFVFTVIDDLNNSITASVDINFVPKAVPMTIELRSVVFNQGSIVEITCGGVNPFNRKERRANVDYGYVIQVLGDGSEDVTAIQFRKFPGQPVQSISPSTYITPSGTVSNVFTLKEYTNLTRYFTFTCGTNSRPSLGSQAKSRDISANGANDYLFDGGSFQVNVFINGSGQGFVNLIGDTTPPFAETD